MTKYKKIEKIGSGGFGEVFKCQRDIDDEIYAMKRLHDEADQDSIKRFIREVRILSYLDHPNIIRIISKKLRNKPYFFIMPLYKCSLRNELQNLIGDNLRINKIFTSILNAIEYAHSQGVIHRDLKPDNILMNSDSDIVVSDFGLGRIVDTDSPRITPTDASIGTEFYISPEQIENTKNANEISDIYSLGIILYEMYTGKTSGILNSSSMPPGIRFLVNRCIKQNPKSRFQSVSDLKKVWFNLIGISDIKSEIDELMQLRTEFSLPFFDSSKIDRLLELLIKYQNDPDLLHDTIIQLDSGAVATMYEKDSDTIKELLQNFINHINNQGWPFDYTDKIGNFCRSLYYDISDFEIRAQLILCVMEVGVSHNRWNVLKIFANLIQSPKEPDEEFVLIELLKNTEKWCRDNATEYITLGKLPERLRHLFD